MTAIVSRSTIIIELCSFAGGYVGFGEKLAGAFYLSGRFYAIFAEELG